MKNLILTIILGSTIFLIGCQTNEEPKPTKKDYESSQIKYNFSRNDEAIPQDSETKKSIKIPE